MQTDGEGQSGTERDTQREHLLSSWVQLSEFGDKGCCTVVTYEVEVSSLENNVDFRQHPWSLYTIKIFSS